MKSLRLNQARIDALVEQLYDINKRLVASSRLSIACLPCSKLSAVRKLCEVIAITVANVFFTR